MSINKLAKNNSLSRITGNVSSGVNDFTFSGGIESTPGNGYKYNTFTSSGNLTATVSNNTNQSTNPDFITYGTPGVIGQTFIITPTATKNVELIAVAGGGGGGVLAGGGGAGGLVYSPSFVLFQVNTITIGGGGSGSPTFGAQTGSPGNGTTLSNTLTIISNGGGGSQDQGIGKTGGSGGGANNGIAVGPGNQPAANPGVIGILQYGNPGGAGSGSSPGDRAGGGGGAGASGTPRGSGATGGAGRQYPQFTGPLIGVPALNPLSGYFAGGGGGGSRADSFPLVSKPGGLGGGGTGETSVTSGTTNSGGGGGGGSFPSTAGGAGGSGIVVIRYINN